MDGTLPKSTSTSAISGAGMMRFFNKVGDSFGKMAFKMEETDQVSDEMVVSGNIAPTVNSLI